MVEVKIKKLRDQASTPSKAKDGDACYDLSYCCEDEKSFLIVINPGETLLVGTGLSFEIPCGYELAIRPRSGLAFKNQITVLNSPGTIDSGYRGEVKVIMINHGKKPFTIKHGDRIAQCAVQALIETKITEVDNLSDSERGEGGFGHTGV